MVGEQARPGQATTGGPGVSLTPTTSLERIADALERIADALGALEAQEPPHELQNVLTLTEPPLRWFEAQEGPFIEQETQRPDLDAAHLADRIGATSQTTWEWLGITPPARRRRAKTPKKAAIGGTPDSSQCIEQVPKNASDITARAKSPGRTPGTISRCGRCRREGTRRMNHSDRCRECLDEEWWDE